MWTIIEKVVNTSLTASNDDNGMFRILSLVPLVGDAIYKVVLADVLSTVHR